MESLLLCLHDTYKPFKKIKVANREITKICLGKIMGDPNGQTGGKGSPYISVIDGNSMN